MQWEELEITKKINFLNTSKLRQHISCDDFNNFENELEKADFIFSFGGLDYSELLIELIDIEAKYLDPTNSDTSDEIEQDMIRANNSYPENYDCITIGSHWDYQVKEGNHRVNSAQKINNNMLIPVFFVHIISKCSIRDCCCQDYLTN